MASSSFFTRKASGLIRNVSFSDAVALNISSMSAGAALATIGYTMVLMPSVTGVNLVYASIIAFIISLPQVYVYSMLTVRMPRTGGDYVWITRSLSPFLGSTLLVAFPTSVTMAYLALIVLSAIFAIGSVGLALGDQRFLGLALPGNTPGADPMSQFLLGAAIFTVLIAINILRPKVGYKMVTLLTAIGILGMILGISTILVAGRNGVVSYMNFLNSIGANATYESVAKSYSGGTFDLGATLFIMPFFAIFVYPWFTAAPAVGSELKGGKNSLGWLAPVSSLLICVLVTASFAAMYYVGGFEFVNSALANPTLVYNYSFNFWTLAMGVSNNFVLSLLIGIGWILWNVAILGFGIIVVSRYLFAGAFDRVLPTKVAHVSKYGSPVVALLINLVVTVAVLGAASFLYGTFVSLYGTQVSPMVYFMIVGIAAAVYGARKEKGQAKAFLVVSGILMAFVFLYLTYEFLAFPGVWGGNILAYGYSAATFLLGVLIYLASKVYHKKKGMDLSFAFKEIPPV